MIDDWRVKPKSLRLERARKGPTLITDGICNLCCSASAFIAARSEHPIHFMWPQHPDTIELAKEFGLGENELKKTWVLIDNGVAFKGSNAWIKLSAHLTQPWRFIFGSMWVFPEFIRETVYGMISRNRYALFGGSNTCQRPEDKRLFSFLHPTENIKPISVLS